ncbi:MAG TPA: C4-type zinc ribbon domain-containing protein [Candidatus Acidoferrum sp.]|nr:C4-type zinc ribbon domain-containing protein [Candidatus Acidoferrum sp.]
MQEKIKRLVELQDVDVRLTAVRHALAGFPARLAQIEARLAVAKKRLADARDAHTTSLKDRKKYELDVEQWKEKAKKYRDQSYEVKTNEAFRALQHEIANAEKEMARAEDRLLERMVAGEEYDVQIKAADAALKEAEAAAAREKAALAEERVAEESKLHAAEAERAAVVAQIPEDLLTEYQRVAKSRGTALAAVVNESCHACGMHVRPHVYQVLRRAGSDEIFHCETCARILYYDEPAVPAELVRGETTASADGAAQSDASADAAPADEKPAAQAHTGGQ